MCADCTVTIQPGEPPVVVISGEIGYECASSISEGFEQLQKEGQLDIDLDCRAVDFIDSSGIGAIVHAAQTMRGLGGRLKLRAGTRQLLHALQVSGFGSLLDIDPATILDLERSETHQRPTPPHQGLRAGRAWSSYQQLRFTIPACADRDGLARRRVTELAEAMPFTPEQIDDIRLAVGEAVSNAVRHGCQNREKDRITIHCTGDCEKLVVCVTNPGRAFDPEAVPPPQCEPLREGGLGICFMKSSMDHVEYSFDENGTTATMVKYVASEK